MKTTKLTPAACEQSAPRCFVQERSERAGRSAAGGVTAGPQARWLAWVLAALLLSVPAVRSQTPIITEFMAQNGNTLNDEDGDSSDWIEIYNPTPATVNLNGWFLTDNAGNPTKWRFPAVMLGSEQFLVVFASGKNRTNNPARLHTNFGLSGDGEYLGLIQPDGVTAASQFAPDYPEQDSDVSYGSLMVVSRVWTSYCPLCRVL